MVSLYTPSRYQVAVGVGLGLLQIGCTLAGSKIHCEHLNQRREDVKAAGEKATWFIAFCPGFASLGIDWELRKILPLFLGNALPSNLIASSTAAITLLAFERREVGSRSPFLVASAVSKIASGFALSKEGFAPPLIASVINSAFFLALKFYD